MQAKSLDILVIDGHVDMDVVDSFADHIDPGMKKSTLVELNLLLSLVSNRLARGETDIAERHARDAFHLIGRILLSRKLYALFGRLRIMFLLIALGGLFASFSDVVFFKVVIYLSFPTFMLYWKVSEHHCEKDFARTYEINCENFVTSLLSFDKAAGQAKELSLKGVGF